jgi:hypothetical protein
MIFILFGFISSVIPFGNCSSSDRLSADYFQRKEGDDFNRPLFYKFNKLIEKSIDEISETPFFKFIKDNFVKNIENIRFLKVFNDSSIFERFGDNTFEIEETVRIDGKYLVKEQ